MNSVLNYGHLRYATCMCTFWEKQNQLSYDLNSYYWRVVMIIKYNMITMKMIVKAVIKKHTCKMFLEELFAPRCHNDHKASDCDVSHLPEDKTLTRGQNRKRKPRSFVWSRLQIVRLTVSYIIKIFVFVFICFSVRWVNSRKPRTFLFTFCEGVVFVFRMRNIPNMEHKFDSFYPRI